MHQTRHTFWPGVDLMVSAGSIFHAGVAHTTATIYTTDALSGLLNGLLSVYALKNSIEIGFIQGLTMVMPTNEDCRPELEPMSTWPLPTLPGLRSGKGRIHLFHYPVQWALRFSKDADLKNPSRICMTIPWVLAHHYPFRANSYHGRSMDAQLISNMPGQASALHRPLVRPTFHDAMNARIRRPCDSCKTRVVA